MYIIGKHRYDNYTSRYDVYLFTLRDYVEVLLDKFKGSYLERSDMPVHSGYLLKFVDIDSAKNFIKGISTSSTDLDKGVVTYVLPHLEGNDLPVYATTVDGLNIVYIGLSDYPDALDEYNTNSNDVKVTISFSAGDGTGTMNDVTVNSGDKYTLPSSTFTPPESKVFSKWNDGESDHNVGDKITITKNTTFTAIYAES